MRLFVVNEDTDLAGLSARLLRGRTTDAHAETTIERLRVLNPHVDFARVSAGTVLLVPDAPNVKTDAGTPAGRDYFEDFVEAVDDGFAAVRARMRDGFERMSADRTEVSALIKTAAVKRLTESDPELRTQLAAATARFKEDQKAAQAADSQLEAMSKKVKEELAAVARLFD